jgi:hypothetical protein
MQVNYPVWKDELNIDRRKLTQIDYNIGRDHHLKGLVKPGRHDQGPALYNNGYKYDNHGYSKSHRPTPQARDRLVAHPPAGL